MKVIRQTIAGTFESSEIKAFYLKHFVCAPESMFIGFELVSSKESTKIQSPIYLVRTLSWNVPMSASPLHLA